MTILSLGAGVQSSTLALMASAGEVEPLPDIAIFADTQSEPKRVYQWLDWLEKQLVFPVRRVSAGNLATESTRLRISRRSGLPYLGHTVPTFTKNHDGTLGMNFRICTDKHKIQPLRKEIHRLRGSRQVTLWIGISLDEVIRVKPSNHSAITHRWPLIEMKMRRQDCLTWMRKRGYPEPPRSACVFCPYHSDAEWLRLKTDDSVAFAEAVAYEKRLQAAVKKIPRLSGIPFLHKSRLPLDTIDFGNTNDRAQQPDLFGNECEGMCGV